MTSFLLWALVASGLAVVVVRRRSVVVAIVTAQALTLAVGAASGLLGILTWLVETT